MRQQARKPPGRDMRWARVPMAEKGTDVRHRLSPDGVRQEERQGERQEERTAIAMDASLEANRRTLAKIVAHHRMMMVQLNRRVGFIASTAEDGYVMQAIAAVRSYLETDLFPHARAEEKVVYPAAVAVGLGGLVDELVADHRRLFEDAQTLTDLGPLGATAEAARRIASLFAVHVERENGSMLPPLAGDAHVDLERLLGEMEDVLASG